MVKKEEAMAFSQSQVVKMKPAWFTQRFVLGVFCASVYYFLLRFETFNYKSSFVVAEVVPHNVWEFVADFSNMKQLNPTLLDFNVISESGNPDHWQYSVDYQERLSHWPYLSNRAIGDFAIESDAKGDVYHIISTHRTCLIGGYLCLNSRSHFKFMKTDGGTLCEEYVEYECPLVTARFCAREVRYQRDEIEKNLKMEFEQSYKSYTAHWMRNDG